MKKSRHRHGAGWEIRKEGQKVQMRSNKLLVDLIGH